MATKILVPTALRAYTDNKDSIEIDGKNVQESILNFLNKFPKLEKHLLTPEGKIRNFVNIYLNDEDIRYLNDQETELKEGDVLSIVPSIAGGNLLPELTNEEIKRYSRHLIMPEVAMTGQKKLKAANVLLIGAGGLGSPAALYLAAAGVGHLGIVDFDVVDLSNLQRQILHGTSSINLSKLDSAKKRLLDLNPNVEISTYEVPLNSENAFDVIREYDVVVDGTDNFPTRYLVNDACVLLEKPNVYGSIFRFEGQVSVFNYKDGPCYRCLYPEPPPPGLVPSCAEGGVLGILPGVIGTLQATETIKLILGQGESLSGRLLLFDALKMNFRELKLRKDLNCPICGEQPTVHKLIDYHEFCGVSPNGNGYDTEFDVSPQELNAELEQTDRPFFLDVREPQEFEICHFDEAKLIPLSQIPDRIHELSTADDIVLYCKIGQRSAQAMNFLKEAGFKKVRNLKGGIDAWAEKVDLEMPRY
jgi:sulfur-carrier protein adenylyltransferase/sulfurtransferase